MLWQPYQVESVTENIETLAGGNGAKRQTVQDALTMHVASAGQVARGDESTLS